MKFSFIPASTTLRYGLSRWLGFLLYVWLLIKRHQKYVSILLWGMALWMISIIIWGPVANEVVLKLLGLGLNLVFAMFFMAVQFIGLFWFMSRTRTTVVRPGDPKQLNFSNYWGQEPLVKMVKEWLFLLKDRGKFKEMGGKPISGILLSGLPGTGKASANSSVLYTPSGSKKMGEIEIGDNVLGSDGLFHPVLGVYPQGVRDIVRVAFNDGTYTRVTPEHLWQVDGRSWDKSKVLSTYRLAEDYIEENGDNWVRPRYRIPVILPAHFSPNVHLLPPYLIGILLAEGCFVSGTPSFSSADRFVIDKVVALLPDKCSLRYKGQYDYAITTGERGKIGANPVTNELRRLGLWGKKSEAKFIPDEYLYDDIDQRLELLQGLMDGDGCAAGPAASYASSSKKMADQVAWLVRSLGGIASVLPRPTDCLTSYRVHAAMSIVPFFLPRKVEAMTEREIDRHRAIVDIHMDGREEATCILIDSPDHLYAVDEFILTHNTLLAKCMAGEGGLAFIGVEGSGFRAMFFGVDVLKVIGFFQQGRKLAREYGACIAYIDELDSIGMSRGGVQGGQTQTAGLMGMGMGSGALTRLLYELDGLGEASDFDNCQNRAREALGLPKIDLGHLLFMGSTNRPDVLDPALTRPGRLDRHIQVDLPDKTGRRAIINGYLGTIHHKDIDVESLVSDTAWATPAKLAAAITKDAVRLALFAGRDYVTQRDIEMGMMEMAMGLQNPIADMEPDQERQVAVHESGHALCQYYLLKGEKIVHLTITRRTNALGFMLPVSLTDQFAIPLDDLNAKIMVSLAGHVATELVFGRPWTGAGGDLQHVRQLVYALASLGYFGSFPLEGKIEGKLAEKVDDFLKDSVAATRRLLEEHRAELDALAEALIARKDMSGDEVVDILTGCHRLTTGGN